MTPWSTYDWPVAVALSRKSEAASRRSGGGCDAIRAPEWESAARPAVGRRCLVLPAIATTALGFSQPRSLSPTFRSLGLDADPVDPSPRPTSVAADDRSLRSLPHCARLAAEPGVRLNTMYWRMGGPCARVLRPLEAARGRRGVSIGERLDPRCYAVFGPQCFSYSGQLDTPYLVCGTPDAPSTLFFAPSSSRHARLRRPRSI